MHNKTFYSNNLNQLYNWGKSRWFSRSTASTNSFHVISTSWCKTDTSYTIFLCRILRIYEWNHRLSNMTLAICDNNLSS